MASDYGNPSYWDERYSKHFDADDQAVFDWYLDYSQLKPHLAPYLSSDPDFEVLIPGCGNSSLGAEMYDDGHVNITNADVSAVVVNLMQERFADRSEMEFTVMDATRMEFLPDDCFNMIVDKALLDALLCGENNAQNVSSMLNEMHRVLKPGGVYVCCSYGVPKTRLGYLRAAGLDWNVQHVRVPKGHIEGYDDMGASDSHFIYICQKGIA